MLFGHSRLPASTQTPFLHALRSLQTPCIDPNAFSHALRSLQTPCIDPNAFSDMHFGHSRLPASTQMLFLNALRSLQTPCIDPNAFSECSSVTPDSLHRPKRLFCMLFGHSRPPASTQTLFLHVLRSLQTPKPFIVTVFPIPLSSWAL